MAGRAGRQMDDRAATHCARRRPLCPRPVNRRDLAAGRRNPAAAAAAVLFAGARARENGRLRRAAVRRP